MRLAVSVSATGEAMTPTEQQRAWYREMLRKFSCSAKKFDGQLGRRIELCRDDLDQLAAHFGRLALGRAQTRDLDEGTEEYKAVHRASVAEGNRCIVEDCDVCVGVRDGEPTKGTTREWRDNS